MTTRYNTPNFRGNYNLGKNFYGKIEAVLPEHTENLVYNPSVENDTDGYLSYATSGTSTITRTTDEQHFGNYGLKCEMDACSGTWSGSTVWFGARYWDSELVLEAGERYTFSVYLKGTAGFTYKIYFYDNLLSTQVGSSYEFVAKGGWQRVKVSIQALNANQHYLYVLQKLEDGQMCNPFYIDGLQVEKKAYATTYCDGDMVGFAPYSNEYVWSSEPHGSVSVRDGQSRHGGKPVEIEELGFVVTGMIGFGMQPVVSNEIKSAASGYSLYQDNRTGDREFTLEGYISVNSPKRRNLIEVFRPNVSSVKNQPMVLRYQPEDCGNNMEYNVEYIACRYMEGLEGDIKGIGGEDVSLLFKSAYPFSYSDRERSVALTPYTTLDATRYLLVRDADTGEWFPPPNDGGGAYGCDDEVLAIAEGPGGYVYIGGKFTNIKISTTANRTARIRRSASDKFDLTTWGNFNGNVHCFYYDQPTNRLYIGGAFTQFGGTTTANRICYYNGNDGTFNAFDSGNGFGDGIVYAITKQDGKIWACGSFTQRSSDSSAVTSVSYYDENGGDWVTSADTNINSGKSPMTFAVINDVLYMGGTFPLVGTTYNGSGVAYYDSASGWLVLGTKTDNTEIGSVDKIVASDSGVLYSAELTDSYTVQGKFWNGTTWEDYGGVIEGQNPSMTATIDEMVFEKFGPMSLTEKMLVAGQFAEVSDRECFSPLLLWNNYDYQPIGVMLNQDAFSNILVVNAGTVETIPGTETYNGVELDGELRVTGVLNINYSAVNVGSIKSLYISKPGHIYMGLTSSALGFSPGLVNVEYDTLQSGFPKLNITGPGNLIEIANITTGKALRFKYMEIYEGETVILDLSLPDQVVFMSNMRGNLMDYIYQDSDFGEFYLAHGENIISVLCASTSGSPDTFITFREVRWSFTEF